jgi:hypothetical protein
MIDFTTLNAAAQVEAKHEALRANNRDLRGCYTDSKKPISRKVAIKKLQAASDKANRGLAMLEAMDNW